MLLTDRTSIETDWLCGMRYWWYKFEGGGGITPAVEPAYYREGRDVHRDLALIAEGMSLDELFEDHFHDDILPAVTSDMAVKETYARRCGWLHAFAKWRWPMLKERYNVVAVEKEMILDRDPLWIAFTADLVLEDKEDGTLVVDDYKSVKNAGPGWVTHWSTAIQMHIQMAGVEEELGRPVKMGHVVGLSKGREKDGKLRHPYVWAYSDGSDDPKKWSSKWRSGWGLRPIWEREGGVAAWVDELGEAVGSAQFPQSAPLFLNRVLLDQMIARRVAREQEIQTVKDRAQADFDYRLLHFEQRFSQCRPVVGSPCPYISLCHNAIRPANPLAGGDFIPRKPHHDVELTIDGDDDDEGVG